jgi:hypothetical protein
MADLINIPGIGKSSLELLEAAGFHNAEALSKVSADDLARELVRANSILKISKRAPGAAIVGKWVDSAREITGLQVQAELASQVPVNYEQTPQVASMLAAAPFAIPLPARVLVENQLGVPDIPSAILLNRYSGDLEVRVNERLPKSRLPQQAVAVNYLQAAESASARLDIDTSRLKSTETMVRIKSRMPADKTSPAIYPMALDPELEDTISEDSDEDSIRGVLHSHPISIMMGALATLLLLVMIPVSVLSALLLLLSGQVPGRFGWVPDWLLIFPVLLPLFGVVYLICGLGGYCRICGQRLFLYRALLKNPNAHYLPGLGYIVPLCFQILAFRWFRCTYCGMTVRLKE